jgi:23S rRNA pseudouridine955/2504/2580 synthase
MLEILYENEDILVVDKPAGLASQPGERVGKTVLSLAAEQFGFTPFPIHRLDRDTSGCMMLARSPQTAARWSALLASRMVRKLYVAVCSGKPQSERGAYTDPIPTHGKQAEARTEYRLLAVFGAGWDKAPFSAIELELKSGRTHQIRRHLAMHDLPILADDKYGDFALNRKLGKEKGLKTLMLWAKTLVLPDGVRVDSMMPEHFTSFFSLWPDSPGPSTFGIGNARGKRLGE